MSKLFNLLLCSIISLDIFSQSILIPHRKGDKWGYSNLDGQILISHKYDSVENFSYNTKYLKVYKRKKTAYLSSITLEQTKFYTTINKIQIMNEIYFVVAKKNKVGLLNSKGEIIVPLKFNSVSVTKKENLNEVILENNIVLLQKKTEYFVFNIETLTQKRVTLKNELKSENLNQQGILVNDSLNLNLPIINEVINSQPNVNDSIKFLYNLDDVKLAFYNRVGYSTKDYYYYIFKNGKIGICSRNTFIPPSFDTILYISKLKPIIIVARQDGYYGIINTKGDNLLSFLYDSIQAFENQFAYIYKNGLIGIFVFEGNKILSPKFKEIQEFYYLNSENSLNPKYLFKAKNKSDKVCYISSKGKEYFLD
jgi:hypothetical protein